MKHLLKDCTGFDWDEGNSEKNWKNHQVTRIESEQVFFNLPIILGDDKKLSQDEKRFYLLGRTEFNRLLFVVFTIRNNRIRIISARDMSKKERSIYYEKI
jgi:uncharacterized DUF497 family protein